MAVDVQPITDDAGLRVARRIDLGSFGLPFDQGAFERALPWLRSTRSWLATEDGEPVGTGRAHALGLTVPGGAVVPISGIGDLGVAPGRRRRGVLGALMGRLLSEGAAAGHVAAALYASEATIYGRFGFGPATRSRKVRIETARAALRPDARPAPGEVEVVEPDRRREVMQPVFDRAAARRSGEVARTDALWGRLLGPAPDGAADTRMCLAHRGADRRWDAYALYSIAADWRVDGPHHVLAVLELVAADPAAELAMWEALLGMDLVRTVEGWMAPDGVLLDALADRWALRTVGEHDTLWVRLLDVPAALASRRYRVPGRLVLQVDPPLREGDAPPVAGVVELDVAADGTARALPGGEPADLRLGAAELASVWLGGGSLSSLAAVGRVEELTPGALRLADAMFGWSPLPRVTLEF